jgi:hypothetical protein
MTKKAFIIVPQLNSGYKTDNHSQTQPQSPEATLFRHKPQIVSIPGISPKERNRYRVVLGDRILGDRLTLDEAIALANQSTHL